MYIETTDTRGGIGCQTLNLDYKIKNKFTTIGQNPPCLSDLPQAS